MSRKVDAPTCACGRKAKRTSGKKLYPHRPDLYSKRFWVCNPCDARVGTHPDGRPFGSLANADLRKLRNEAHQVFDPIWREGPMNRSEAYAWLAKRLDLPIKRVHIGHTDEKTCRRIIRICLKRREWS